MYLIITKSYQKTQLRIDIEDTREIARARKRLIQQYHSKDGVCLVDVRIYKVGEEVT